MFELLETTTAREYEIWMAWLDLQWDIPTRTDFYLMQIALEVVRSRIKSPGQIKLKDLWLKFNHASKNSADKLELENQLSKAKWLASMTKKPQVLTSR